MRLLIDEMFPPAVAQQLRAAGRDALSVVEQPALIGGDDNEIWRFAVMHRMTIVSENAADFLVISTRATAAGEAAPSLVLTTNRSFPRHARSFIGRVVRSLAAFCEEHPGDDPQAGVVYWLRPGI